MFHLDVFADCQEHPAIEVLKCWVYEGTFCSKRKLKVTFERIIWLALASKAACTDKRIIYYMSDKLSFSIEVLKCWVYKGTF